MKKEIAIIWRGYKVLYKLIPGYLPVAATRAVFGAALPFVNIVISAMIINAFSQGQGIKRVLFLAFSAAVINFIVQTILYLLKRISSYLSASIWSIYERPLNEKQQEMDFSQIEDPETRFMRQKIFIYRNTSGNGILSLFWTFENMVTNFLTVVLSIGIFAPVFSSLRAEGGFWSFMNTTWFAALFVFILIGNAALSMVLVSQNTKKRYDILKGFHFPNMIGNYFVERIFNKYSMGKDIKVNKLQDCIVNMIKTITFDTDTVIHKLANLDTKYKCLESVAATILSAVIYIFVAVKTVLGGFGVGNVVQYVGSITRFNTGFTGLAINIAELFSNVEALKLYFEFLDKPNKIYHGTIPVEKRSDNEYEIEFHNVSFKYPGNDMYALKDLNLKLKIGQRMAVVGMNGSGKTTMIKLLCRLYDPTDGEITLNGIDIRKYGYQEYMSIFSVVFQDFKLFSFTLGQNVAANIEYDASKVRSSLAKAGLSERLASMPKGLDTPLYKDFDDDGIEISGGEAQKIAIARALYKEAPFIVLDEPTAALDPIAEFEVYSKFNDIVGDKTAIFISHRLSSCRFCNDIAVFHEGKLIQRGSHEELITDENGKYYELWNAQAQYYVNE